MGGPGWELWGGSVVCCLSCSPPDLSSCARLMLSFRFSFSFFYLWILRLFPTRISTSQKWESHVTTDGLSLFNWQCFLPWGIKIMASHQPVVPETQWAEHDHSGIAFVEWVPTSPGLVPRKMQCPKGSSDCIYWGGVEGAGGLRLLWPSKVLPNTLPQAALANEMLNQLNWLQNNKQYFCLNYPWNCLSINASWRRFGRKGMPFWTPLPAFFRDV